jgi:hypothetical protein
LFILGTPMVTMGLFLAAVMLAVGYRIVMEWVDAGQPREHATVA